MSAPAFTHFVFVDFENVPTIDLGLLEGKSVHVTLLIGKKQTWLDLTLVRQIHRLATQVGLVEVGASGHNALDLTLSYYLGQATQRTPKAEFCIVSKDKDFEAMIGHVQGTGIRISRHDSFATLPFMPKTRKSTPTKTAAPAKAGAPAKAFPPDDRLERLVTRLKNNSAPRPKKRSSLLARIGTDFGNKLSEVEQNAILAELVRREVLAIDPQDKVSYNPAS